MRWRLWPTPVAIRRALLYLLSLSRTLELSIGLRYMYRQELLLTPLIHDAERAYYAVPSPTLAPDVLHVV